MSTTSSSQKGGESTFRGMEYQKKFAAYLCVEMLNGKIKRVTCERLDDIETEEDSKIIYYQIKSTIQDSLPKGEILKSFNLFFSIDESNKGTLKKEYVLVCNKRIGKFKEPMQKCFFNELDNEIQQDIKSTGATDNFLDRTYLMKGFPMEEIENNILAELYRALSGNYYHIKIVDELLHAVNNMCSGRLDQKDIKITYSNETEQQELNHKTMTLEQLNEIIERNRMTDETPSQVPTEEQLQKELKLRNYLKYCVSLIHRPNSLDSKSLNDLYIPNNAILLKADTWNTRDEEISEKSGWDSESFLKSEQRLVYVSAVYGIGKTSWSYELAADLATKNLNKIFSDYFPIHIPLKHGLNRVDDKGNTLDVILSLLNEKTKILFIFDALDELETRNVGELTDKISTYLTKYQNSKAIVTTRPNQDYRSHIGDNYVRLLPFTPDQVNEFFRKYCLTIDYNTISTSGLESDEICKPLFCWLLAIVHDRKLAITLPDQVTLNRVLLFSTIIHEVILGKEKTDARSYGHNKHAFDEKLVLRKIAELKHIYGNDLTKDNVLKIVKKSHHVNQKVLEFYDKLISTYFYTSDDNTERLDFIHRSFEEYLLAEHYIECLLRNEPFRINLKIPTVVTIQFFNGLLQLFKTDSTQLMEYAEKIVKTFRNNLNIQSMKTALSTRSNEWFDNESVQPVPKDEYPNFKEPAEYSSLHRWIGIIVFNSLPNLYGIDSKKFFKLHIATHGTIPDYMVQIDDIDLSGYEFEGDTPNLTLVNAKLKNCKLSGTFHGTNFSGANLTNCIVSQSTHLLGCNFTGTNLTRMKSKADSPYSPDFNDCNFSDSKLIGASVRNSRFSDCDFSDADFSGMEIGRTIFSSCNLSKLKFNNDTDTTAIELLGEDDGTGFNKEWDDLKSNKDLVNYLLSKIDDRFRQKIFDDNPDLKFSAV
jgi:uncharacterized protein YjbI with pentapeptide repeats